MTNLYRILKTRDITLPTKVHLVKAMVFPVVRYGCESWTIKKAERWRIDSFELWCWRRLLRVPWTARRSNQSILKEISPEYSLEGLVLKLKLHYFGKLTQSTDSLEKTLMLGKTEGGREGDDRGWDGWMASPTQWTWVRVNSRSWWWIGWPDVLQSMGSQRVGHNWAIELNYWYIVGEGNGNPLQYSCLENPMDGGAWWAAVHGVAKSRTWLSDFTLTFHFPALEKEMATHSSVLAWRIPGMGEPRGLMSMGSHRVGHEWSDLAAAAALVYGKNN